MLKSYIKLTHLCIFLFNFIFYFATYNEKQDKCGCEVLKEGSLLKHYLEKAYNKINWVYLDAILELRVWPKMEEVGEGFFIS